MAPAAARAREAAEAPAPAPAPSVEDAAAGWAALNLRQQQQRLLLLRHASKCPHENGNCPVTPHCVGMKRLWKHIAECKDQQCQMAHCVSSRYVLSHYHRCKDPRCAVCGPVREAIQRNHERIDARMQEAILHHRYCAELANQMRESIKGVAAEYVCPLTLELLVDPVVAKDGQIYERSHILAWLSRNATSPVTREPMGMELTPVPRIRNSIEKLVSSGAIEGEVAEAWQKASAKQRADETKVKEIRGKAEGGDAEAMYKLGLCYRSGRGGLAQDAVQTRAWLERSAVARNPTGLATFGFCLLSGIGGPQDSALGLVNVSQAAALGSDSAAYLLGSAFFLGKHGLPKDPVRARYWLKKAVDGECEFKHLSHDDRFGAEGMVEALESGGE